MGHALGFHDNSFMMCAGPPSATITTILCGHERHILITHEELPSMIFNYLIDM